MASKNPRAITGVGLIASGADTTAALFDRLLAGERPDPASLPAGCDVPAVGIEGFRVRDYIDRRGLKSLSRTSRLACAAASRLTPGLDGVPVEAIGVVFGTAWASLETIVRFEREAHVEGPRFVDPILFTETVANVPAGQVSIVYGWSALNTTISSGTASGIAALIQAGEFLDEDRAGVVVAGAADELNPHLLRSLRSDGRISGSARPSPHARGAEGAVAGEGACLFAIESSAHAADRGASVLGFLGPGVARYIDESDGDESDGDESDGDESGSARVDRRAQILTDLIESDGLRPDQIDLVVLSGNGDPRRDGLEAALIQAVFGDDPPPAALPKAYLGETWGAAGGFGVAVALEAIARSTVPPAPRGLEPSSAAVRLSALPLSCDVRHALVLDCPAASHIAAQIVRADG